MANANFIVQNGITLGGQGGGSISTDPTTGALVIAPAPTAGNANPVAVVISTSGTVSTVATTNGVANAANVATVANIAAESSLTTLANVTITGNLLVQGVATYTSTETVLGVEVVAGNLVANSGTASSSTSAGALVVAGGAGISGDLFVGGNVHTTGTAYLKIPAGTTAQRPGSANVALGMIRYNSTISSFEGFGAGSAWSSLGGVKSVDGKAYISAEASAGAGDDVLRFYSGSTGSSVQVAWASGGNVSILPSTETTAVGTGALQVTGGASIGGNTYVANNLYVGSNSFGRDLSVPTIIASDNGGAYAQIAMINTNSSGSSDYAAYSNNGNDSGGWVDMGIAGATFSDPTYSITRPQDGYIITRPTSSTYGGNLVVGTSEAGSYNDITFSVGSFYANAEVARFHGNASTGGTLSLKQGTASSSTTTGALTVAGGVGVTGAVYVGNGIFGTVSTAVQNTISTASGLTSFGTAGVTTTAQGNLTVVGNLTVQGNITTTGNVTNVTITGNSGQYFGNVSGFGALYAGIGSGFFVEPQMVFQASANYNGFAGGLNIQNINSGSLASSDVFWTPNNGTADDTFLDIGIASSTYSYPGYGLIKPNDSYIISYGNAVTAGGNLLLSAGAANDIIFTVQGVNANNEVMRITRANVVAIKSTVASTTTTSGALTVAGGVGIAGAVYIGGAAGTSVVHSGHILPSANLTYNLGSSTAWYNTFYGVSTQAKYADLAENYQADKPYAPGTVVMFGGSAEVTVAENETTAVAGVVSTNPAHLMNGSLTGTNVIPLALQGRVPCNVIGPVKKGDMMISAGFGYAKSATDPKVGQVIGKSLNDFSGAKGQIEVVVGRV